ncbi:hypothetical protein B0A80_07880 [Flavobacterium tructae]|nr:hypothetical protein B0A80_07880 [Flavobacterium tructae]
MFENKKRKFCVVKLSLFFMSMMFKMGVCCFVSGVSSVPSVAFAYRKKGVMWLKFLKFHL